MIETSIFIESVDFRPVTANITPGRLWGHGERAAWGFLEWREAGLFEEMWKAGLLEYDKEKGIEWEWQSMDGAMTKAPLGGEGTGANPTDRGKKGTKRSIERPSPVDIGQNMCMDKGYDL